MPLRDHFRPPLSDRRSWEGFHGGWPMMIVDALGRSLSESYFAEPRIDTGSSNEVRLYDTRRGRRLVAAVELVSPANKDRPEHRRAFVAKCAAMLQERVCVAIVDVVTTRSANLYGELLEFLERVDPSLGNVPPPIYAADSRFSRGGEAPLLETWANTLAIGQVLPTLPLWVAPDLPVPLELEASYEGTCRVLRIP
jgi:hypothetical protein